MGISIKNEEVEALIRQMAKETGKPLTEAVGDAVEYWLLSHQRRREEDEAARQKRLDELIKRIHAWPVADPRPHGEILYDEDGLPK